jgi:hypothetical protein
MKHFLIAAATAVALAAPASAATVASFTEGTRALVDGTVRINPSDTSPNPAGAFDLLAGGSLSGGESVEVYGRIVDSVDNFFFINAATAFTVNFIFGGYDVIDGQGNVTSSTSVSGFTGEPAGQNPGKTAIFRLLDAGNGFSEVDAATFTSDVTSGPERIFSAGAGQYVFQVDGSCQGCSTIESVGLYDIEISAVPLPASVLLLLAGMGGLGVIARRKSA